MADPPTGRRPDTHLRLVSDGGVKTGTRHRPPQRRIHFGGSYITREEARAAAIIAALMLFAAIALVGVAAVRAGWVP